MRTLVLLLLCAQLAACGDDSAPKLAPTPGFDGSAPRPEAEVDIGPPMPAAGSVIEFKSGVRVEVVVAGAGRAARAGRTVVLHQRTRELPAPSKASQPESAPADAPVEEAAPVAAPESAPAVAEAAASQPVEISSTWRSGIPLTAALGRGELIEGLEQALEGMRAGSRLQVRVPERDASAALEIEIELVEVR